jgi:MoaA/NifB/PqqE/SkfB family radical SAM enzyme
VRKDFFEIYDAMREMGLMISINSNGSMLDGEIRRRLLENPPFRINISLYGGCRETYRNMCGQDAFGCVVENIRAIKGAGVDVSLNLSITPYNRQDLAKIHEIACDLDVNVKATAYMYPPIRVNGQQFGCGNRLTPEEAAQCIVQWDRLRLDPEAFVQRAEDMRKKTLDEADTCAMELSEGVSCRAGSTSFWMTWDGKMLPCGMMPDLEVRPLEIGFDAAWAQIRAQTQKIRMPAACVRCANRKICGVCAAVCVTETGGFESAPEYMCQKTQARVRLMDEACPKRKGD